MICTCGLKHLFRHGIPELTALGWLWRRAWFQVTPPVFSWQVWHLGTWTFALRSKRGMREHPVTDMFTCLNQNQIGNSGFATPFDIRIILRKLFANKPWKSPFVLGYLGETRLLKRATWPTKSSHINVLNAPGLTHELGSSRYWHNISRTMCASECAFGFNL